MAQQSSSRSSLERYHLRKQVQELENKTSHIQSTTLVTLYIPPGTRLSDITQKLTDEMGTATSIKDKNTGKAVAEALRSILARMQYLENGENGLAIFAGVTQEAGKMEYHLIIPPDPISKKDYICDSRFHVEYLKEMFQSKDQLGVIVIDRGGATFALIRGNYLNILADEDSFVPGKHGRGGQSAGRIERGIEILAQEYFSKMARLANQLFIDGDKVIISGLVVGGPAMSKDSYLEHPTLDYRLKDKVIGTYDTGYTGEQGIRELLSKAGDDLADFAIIKEKKLYNKWLEELGMDSGKAIYGEAPIKKAFSLSAIDTLLFSEAIEKLHVKIQCSSCNKEFLEASKPEDVVVLQDKISKTPCPNCSKEETLSIINKEHLIDEFMTLAKDTGAEIEIIGVGHEDGQTLMKTFGGLAAILRFPVDW